MIITITNKDLEQNAIDVSKDIKYGKENEIIDKALKENPLNTNIATVAMKICLIDITNGTNLSRNLGTKGGLYKLSKKIINSNFDERVKNGDLTLVNELAKWTKENLDRNLLSFISKYCLYHNVHCYNKDDYAIFDSVLRDNLYKYISAEDFKNITGKELKRDSFDKFREEFNYLQYMEIIDHIIKNNNIIIDKPHRKLDWFIWYKNRKNNYVNLNSKNKQ